MHGRLLSARDLVHMWSFFSVLFAFWVVLSSFIFCSKEGFLFSLFRIFSCSTFATASYRYCILSSRLIWHRFQVDFFLDLTAPTLYFLDRLALSSFTWSQHIFSTQSVNDRTEHCIFMPKYLLGVPFSSQSSLLCWTRGYNHGSWV